MISRHGENIFYRIENVNSTTFRESMETHKTGKNHQYDAAVISTGNVLGTHRLKQYNLNDRYTSIRIRMRRAINTFYVLIYMRMWISIEFSDFRYKTVTFYRWPGGTFKLSDFNVGRSLVLRIRSDTWDNPGPATPGSDTGNRRKRIDFDPYDGVSCTPTFVKPVVPLPITSYTLQSVGAQRAETYDSPVRWRPVAPHLLKGQPSKKHARASLLLFFYYYFFFPIQVSPTSKLNADNAALDVSDVWKLDSSATAGRLRRRRYCVSTYSHLRRS